MEKNKIKLLYIASNPYSGSTLLTFLLANHPSIATAGELSGPDPKVSKDEHMCSCGMRTKECKFWLEIERRMAIREIPFTIFDQDKRWKIFKNRYIHYGLTLPSSAKPIDFVQKKCLLAVRRLSNKFEEYMHRNVAVIEEILTYNKAEVFLDSSKDIDRLQLLRRETKLDVYVLHLVRDGRGQTFSQIRRGRSIEQAAKSLCRFDGAVSRLAKLLPESRYFRIRYEDICRNPAEMREKISEFVGIEAVDIDEFTPPKTNHILGNPMRLQFTGKIAEDDRWRAQLTEKQLQDFQRIAGVRNRDFGYE